MTTKILSFCIFALASICAFSQENKAKSILDKTSATIKNAGDIKADFSASSSSGSMNGTIYIHKSMFHLQSNNVKCWYNGKTLWTYRKSTNEVNITTPTRTEQQNINPYLFINIYKKGYSYSLKEISLKGKNYYEVTLNATSKSSKLRKMIITIDKTNYYPIKVCMQRTKGETEINILNCKTKQKFNDNTFSFNKKDFPGVEIIDLR